MGWFQKRSAFAVVFIIGSVLLLTREAAATSGDPSSTAVQARKLLNISESPLGIGTGHYSTTVMGPNDCSEEDVEVYQNSDKPLPSGIPTYNVRIINVCDECRVSDVHIACGYFASTELVDPAVFQRVSYNDCVVKGGGAMSPGETVSFQYSNSFSYPLSVVSVDCA